MSHVVAVLVPERVVALDLSIPCQVFGGSALPTGEPAYEVRVCGSKTADASMNFAVQFRIVPPFTLADAGDADTVIVAGIPDPATPIDELVEVVRTAYERGARVASVCTGAFVLAAAGVLNGRRATTHWSSAGILAEVFPDIEVDPDVLYVDNEGRVLTSAGVASGLDMCLHMVASDFGAAVAATTARSVVVPMIRDGGQAQFIVHDLPSDAAPVLQPTLTWMSEHLHEPLTLEDIATHAAMSIRTLNRRFREHVGTTPLQWLLTLRIERAKELLETTDLSVERIADEVGFGSSVTLRHHFGRRVRVPPQRYRSAFRTPANV